MCYKREKNGVKTAMLLYIFAFSLKTGVKKDNWILMSTSAFDLLWQHLSHSLWPMPLYMRQSSGKKVNSILGTQDHENSFDLLVLLKQPLGFQRCPDHVF